MSSEEWMSGRVNLVSAIDRAKVSRSKIGRTRCTLHRNDRDRPTSEDDDV